MFATVLCIVIGARFLFAAVSPRNTLDIGIDGMSGSKGRSHWRLPWHDVARARVVVGHRGGRVVWLVVDAAKPDRFPAYRGGFRVFPIAGHRRGSQVSEPRAAPSWYAPGIRDAG